MELARNVGRSLGRQKAVNVGKVCRAEARPTLFPGCLLLFIILLSGCSSTPELWQKTGGNQVTFNLDAKECELIAREVALLQSETGKRIDPAPFSRAYLQCLDAKGWTRKLAQEQVDQSEIPLQIQPLAQAVSTGVVSGFGQTIALPEAFNLLINKQIQVRTTIMDQFFWQGDGGTFMNILFQDNRETTFEQLPYPVNPPNQLYTSGTGSYAKERLRWAAFYAKIENDWIMGLGAYYYNNKKQRIIVVVTAPLSQPEDIAPGNVTLSRNQYLQIEDFSAQWQTWLNEQFQQGPGLMKRFLQALRFGM